MLKKGNTDLNKGYIGNQEVKKAYLGDILLFQSEAEYYLNLTKLNQDKIIVGDNDYGTDFVDRSYSYGVEFEKTLTLPTGGTNDLITNSAFSPQKVGIAAFASNIRLFHDDNGSPNVALATISLQKTIVKKIDVTYDKPTTTIKLFINDGYINIR